MFDSKIWYKFDYLTLLLTLALITIGIITIGGATYATDGNTVWVKQLIFAIVGLFLLIGILFLDYRVLIRYSPLYYTISLISLILCYVPGLSHKAKGAYSWIEIPIINFTLQPSEFVKIATILMLARVLGARRENWNSAWDVIFPLMIGAIPSILIATQPDIGTASVFIPVTLLMMFVAGMPYPIILLLFAPLTCFFGVSSNILFILIWVAILASLLLLAITKKTPLGITIPCILITVLAYFVVFQYGTDIWDKVPEYQKARIYGYMNPEFDPNGANFNVNQSKIALGSGGFWGKGIGEGTQSKFGFLPEFEHDFIFSLVGEQFGFFWASILLGMFLLLILRGVDTAMETKTLQGSLISSGVVSLFFSHIFINVGMVTGLLPVTGLPLTFISQGGSFLITSMIGVGLIMNIRMRTSEEMLREGFSSDRPSMALPTKFSDDF